LRIALRGRHNGTRYNILAEDIVFLFIESDSFKLLAVFF